MGGAPAGPSRAIRLDPRSFTARAPAHGGATAFSISAERAGVIFTRGDDVRLVPFTAYRGVAVRMVETHEAGRVRVFVELLHADRTLTVPLAVADDPDGVAADWQKWGELLRQPLLVVAADGSVSAPLATMGALVVCPPKLRRRPAHFRARRPRFLVRRKAGRAAGLPVLAGREIIARR